MTIIPIRSGRTLSAAACAAAVLTGTVMGGSELYTVTNLGIPEGADSAVGVRMNNHGHVAGWSQYFGVGEPSLRGWVWTPESGFIMLPPPPSFFEGRSRAMDINDNGVVEGLDLGMLLANWSIPPGTPGCGGAAGGCPADLNGDGVVDGVDLGLLLSNWTL